MTRYYARKHEDGSLELSTDSRGPELYHIDAETWEEAMTLHHLRQGWEPYNPGKADECSVCGALYYPEGSGVCYRGHVNVIADHAARGESHPS